MTNGKGDKRRPRFVSESVLETNWQLAFQRNIDAMIDRTNQEVAIAFGLKENTNAQSSISHDR